MNRETVKVQFIGADLLKVIDSLDRVATSISPYQQPMFMGGPVPADVLAEVKKYFEEKIKDAPEGPSIPPLARGDQR